MKSFIIYWLAIIKYNKKLNLLREYKSPHFSDGIALCVTDIALSLGYTISRFWISKMNLPIFSCLMEINIMLRNQNIWTILLPFSTNVPLIFTICYSFFLLYFSLLHKAPLIYINSSCYLFLCACMGRVKKDCTSNIWFSIIKVNYLTIKLYYCQIPTSYLLIDWVFSVTGHCNKSIDLQMLIPRMSGVRPQGRIVALDNNNKIISTTDNKR